MHTILYKSQFVKSNGYTYLIMLLHICLRKWLQYFKLGYACDGYVLSFTFGYERDVMYVSKV